MPRSSFGHVRQRDSGRWQARYQDTAGRQHSATFRTKEEARKWLRDESKDRDDGRWVDPRAGRVPFSEWAEHWQVHGVRGLRPTTVQRDIEYLNRYILPTFGGDDLRVIDHAKVVGWVGRLSDRLAPSTVHKCHQILSKVMRSAVVAKKISANPCDGVDLPRIEPEEMRFLTPAEVDKVAETIDRRYRPLVYLAAYGGLRAGELFGLRVGRLLPGCLVDVVEGVSEVDCQLTVGPLKTRAARRRVHIPQTVFRMLTEHSMGKSSDMFVFEAPRGGPIRRHSWESRFWRPALTRAGLEGVRLHDCRHTAVAFWIAAGASPVEVARRAGHSSVSVVLDRYGHLLPGVEDRVTDALESWLSVSSAAFGGDQPGLEHQRL